MAGVNKAMLIGHVGRDAEVRYTQGGQAVANFSVATSETWGGKDGKPKQEKTEWHNIVCWGRQAEIAGQYVKKGRQLYVEGKLQTSNWVDPQGVKHYKTEINCYTFQLLGKKDTSQPDDDQWKREDARQAKEPIDAGYEIGDLGPPMELDDNPLSPGD